MRTIGFFALWLLYGDNRVKRFRRIIVVYLYISVVVIYGLAYAFDAKPMLVIVVFCGTKAAVCFGKRIFTAGIDNRNHDKRGFLSFTGI